MRGLLKVTALLSAALSSAFVIPSSLGNEESKSVGSDDTHGPSEVGARITIDGKHSYAPDSGLELRVTGTSEACGESNLKINGHELPVSWFWDQGIHKGDGRGLRDVFAGFEASWNVECIYDPAGLTGDSSASHDVVHILRLVIHDDTTHDISGFTISFKQHESPSIVRFEPSLPPITTVKDLMTWRTPQPSPHEIEIQRIEVSITEDEHVPNQVAAQQKGLVSSLETLRKSVKDKFKSAVKKLGFCQKFLGGSSAAKNEHQNTDQERPDDLSTTPTIKVAESTNTFHSQSAAETRSLHDSDQTVSTPDYSTSETQSPAYRPTNHFMKVLAVSLGIFAIFLWLVLACRDPRRRAEWAARCEERRNKRLYRRAARKQAIQNWIWNIRVRYRLLATEVLNANEKQGRVHDQEAILEEAMKQDIRALRHAHRVVSDITAAEEGQNGFAYGAESSFRRQPSMSTLPGYESEGTEPPSYDAAARSLQRSFTGNGSDTDPDSSIVSTSPRISRDGTNSDFDEKIEVLSLDPSGISAIPSNRRVNV